MPRIACFVFFPHTLTLSALILPTNIFFRLLIDCIKARCHFHPIWDGAQCAELHCAVKDNAIDKVQQNSPSAWDW